MEESTRSFLRVLDATDNSTGGGTASAIAGAMAAGMIAMVARISIGKKDMEPAEHYEAIAQRGEGLVEELLNGAREDSEAFGLVSAAYRMPKKTELQRTDRSKAIQEALRCATAVPLENARRCHEALGLASSLRRCFNTNAASDLECAEHLARAGILGCAANVRINLPSIVDQAVVEEMVKQLEQVLGTMDTA